jgi:hypothetical protein
MTVDLPRASLFIAVLIVLGGYLTVYRPMESTIAERYTQLDSGRTVLERSLALIRRTPALVAEQSVLEAQLGHVHVHDRRAVTVERFLREVAGVARRAGIAVESVAADVRQGPLPAAGQTQAAPFDELAFDVSLRGRYSDVIRAVRELNAGDVATRINLASLGTADRRPGAGPQLNAAFHVHLLREADDKTTKHIARLR